MKKILLARIDDRLIHGQVMTAWLRYVKSKHILIVDDETYRDSFIKSFIQTIIPKDITITILDVKNALEFLKYYEGAGLAILAKYPQTFYLLIEGGIVISEIIIGGMGAKENRKILYKNICVSDEELDVLNKIVKLGVSVKIKIVPDEKGISLNKLR